MNKYPLYKIGKFILGPIFRLYYNPKIVGLENLREEGPKVIAGNHIHLYDQCHTIISTKEVITFLAKKEYFDSNKTRWFFKGVGCIPVDRSKKDEHASTAALYELHHDRSIGLFPEGTRNAFKEEKIKTIYEEFKSLIDYDKFAKLIKKAKASQIDFLLTKVKEDIIKKEDIINNLKNIESYLIKLVKENIITKDEYYDSYFLDFKFGAVSMAKKEDAKIVPVVVSGDYKFRSKNLIVRYGKPFKVTDMDLKDANLLLRKNMIQLLKENMGDS